MRKKPDTVRWTETMRLEIKSDDGGHAMPRTYEAYWRGLSKLMVQLERDKAKEEKRKPVIAWHGFKIQKLNEATPPTPLPEVLPKSGSRWRLNDVGNRPGRAWDTTEPEGRELVDPDNQMIITTAHGPREVRVLAVGEIGRVCMTGRMLACEAQAIWPLSWPDDVRIVVYRSRNDSRRAGAIACLGQWAYAQDFVANYTPVPR